MQTREHKMDSVMERIIINADDNDDTSESTVSCDDNDDTQEAGPIISDSEWSEVKWVVKWVSEEKWDMVKFLWIKWREVSYGEVPSNLYWGYLL